MVGMITGWGRALLEDGVFDPQTGRIVSASLADYLVYWAYLACRLLLQVLKRWTNWE
jgi:hypothetical protein